MGILGLMGRMVGVEFTAQHFLQVGHFYTIYVVDILAHPASRLWLNFSENFFLLLIEFNITLFTLDGNLQSFFLCIDLLF